MQNADQSIMRNDQGITSNKPQIDNVHNKRSSKILVIALILIVIISLLALTTYLAYNMGKEKGKKASSDDISQSQEDASQDTDISTQDTSTTTTTTITTDEESDPYEGWEIYENTDFLITELKYPSTLTPKVDNDNETIYFNDDKNNTLFIIYQTISPIDSQEWCSNKGSVDYSNTEVTSLNNSDYGYICLLDGNEEYYLQYYVPAIDIWLNIEAGNSLGKELFLSIINSIKLVDTTEIAQ